MGAEDTLVITVDKLTATDTGVKLRVWAIICHVDGHDADEVDCDYLA